LVSIGNWGSFAIKPHPHDNPGSPRIIVWSWNKVYSGNLVEPGLKAGGFAIKKF